MAMVLERVFTSTALGLKADSWLGSKRQLSMHLCEAEMRCRRVAALEAQCDSLYKAPSHPIPSQARLIDFLLALQHLLSPMTSLQYSATDGCLQVGPA